MKRWPAGLILLLCAAAVSPTRAAELDEVQSHLLTPHHLPLRWDTISAGPSWVSGIKPAYHHDVGMQIVQLPPGGHVAFYVPPGSAVRVVDPAGELTAEDVEVSVSDGTGLHAYLPAQPGGDGRSLLVSPCSPAPLIARVHRPHRAQKPACVGVFVSRVDPLGEVAPYRCLIPFPANACMLKECDDCAPPRPKLKLPGWAASDKVQRSDETTPRPFWRAEPGSPLRVEVTGPARLAVQTRFHYPPTESRAIQSYRVHVRAADLPLPTLEYQTSLEGRRTITVNRYPEVLGRLETAYLEVPAGKQVVTFDATAPLYLCLLAQRPSDYHLPGHNAPRLTAEAVRARVSAEVAGLAPWSLTAEQAARIADLPPVAVAEKERLALRLIRDNRHREGGLAGAMLLHDLALQRPDYPAVRDTAGKFRRFHTAFRDLMPLHKPVTEARAVCRFVPRRLYLPGEAAPELQVPSQLREDLIDRMPMGSFLRLPRGQPGMAYPVPERFGPSDLRVVAIRPSEGPLDFFVQVDGGAPLRLRVHPGADAPESAFVPSEAEAALATLPGPPEGRTLQGPFAATRTPAPLVQAGLFELPLPAGSRTVRVWGAPWAKEAPRVAVQYRAGKTYRMSETEFIEAARRSGEGADGHRAFIGMLKGQPAGDDPTVREVVNQWQPLLRLLRAQDRLFRAATSPQREADTAPLDEKAEATLLQDARRLGWVGNHLAALPLWAQLIRGTTGPARHEAIFGRIDALLGLGEPFLADRMLRGAFLLAPEPATRAEARVRLEKLARRAGDADALVAIAAVEALRAPNPPALASLAEALALAGEYEAAMMAGLGVAPPHRPVRCLLRCAHRMRWWRVHDSLAAQLPGDERGLWSAHRALAEGDEAAAATLAAGAGESGRRLAAHLAAGQRVRAGLTSARVSDRGRALADWMTWLQTHPGPHNWFDAHELVLDACGAASLYSIGRDLHAGYFEATKDRPVKVGVFGPLRLKVEARPLHAKAADPAPLDDWLTVRGPGDLRLMAVNGNFPTSGVELVGRPDHLPGSRVEHEINVGPGWHELAIAPESRPTLIRVYAWRPEMPLPVLPPLTAETVARFLGEGVDLPLMGRASTAEAEEAAALTRGLAGLMEVAQRPAGTGDADLLRRMTQVARLAEVSPADLPRALALGQALAASHPRVPGLADLRQRLTRQAAWEPVNDIVQSAGVRRESVEGWDPESPMLRVRRALIGPLRPHDSVVAGYDRFVLSVENKAPTKVRMELAVKEVAHLPARPLTAVYQIDDLPPVTVALSPHQPPRSLMLDLPAGPHGVRVWIDRPVANQYLAVGFTEGGKPLNRPLERTYQVATAAEPIEVAVEGPAWVRIDERQGGQTSVRYRAVAVGERPLLLRPPPGHREALFRVFRQAAATGRAVPPRYLPVVQAAVPPPLIVRAAAPIPPGPPAAAVLVDEYPLGLQDLGTFSVLGGYRSRRALDEDNVPGGMTGRKALPDQFLETRLTHRLFDEWRQSYFQSDLIYRHRDDSGPTLGLMHHLRHDPVGVPVTLHLEGAAFLQQPGGAIAPGTSRLEGAGWLRGRVTQYRPLGPMLGHQPTLAAFGRVMSLDRDRYLSGRVDQDIYTPYKADHQGGWVLSDALTWSPSLDTQAWAGLGLTSNEDFLTPDHLAARLGVRHLVGAVEVNASYTFLEFFASRDRKQSAERHIIDAGLRCDLSYLNRDRVELVFNAEYEFVRQAAGLQVFLAWHFGNGRGYRDFRPDEVPFLGPRRRHSAEGPVHSVFVP